MTALYSDWYSQVYPSRLVGGAKMSGSFFAHDDGWFYGAGLFARQIPGNSGFLPPTKTVRDTLIGLAEATINAQKRNYLLSEYLMETEQAGEVGDKIAAMCENPKIAFAAMDDNAIDLMPMDVLFRIMAVSLQSSKSLEKDIIVGLQLVDMPESIKMQPWKPGGNMYLRERNALLIPGQN